MTLAHFYHVYADGHWAKPAEEHFTELDRSGLMDELDDVFLGIVGTPENRALAKKQLPGVVVAEQDTGWEQVTLEALREHATLNDGAVFYAHTKGAWSNSDLADAWRISMTYDNVARWRECVEALKTHDAVGAYWLRSDEPEHREHDFFFAGNFWWANNRYIRSLPPVRNDTRYRAEAWIGLGNPRVSVLRAGYSYWGNFWQPHS